jgi:CRP/FNR family transcriptional regulator, anaerobic regulatory protein
VFVEGQLIFKVPIPHTNSKSANPAHAAWKTIQGDKAVFAPLVMPECHLPGCPERRTIPAGTKLFTQGDGYATAYFIDQGVVRLSKAADDGTSSVMGLRSNGCILEPSSVLLDTACYCSAETLIRSVILTVPVAEFRQVMLSDLSLLREFNDHLALEIESLEEQEAILRSGSVDERLRQLVLELRASEHLHKNQTDTIEFKHREIAHMLAISPAHLSRLLRRFR